MYKSKASRTYVNLLGIPLVIFIIWFGDIKYSIPLYSLFILLILIVSANEFSGFITNSKAKPNILLLKIFIIITQIFRYYSNINNIEQSQSGNIIIILLLILLIIELFNNSEEPLYNVMFILFGYVWIGMMLGSLSLLRNISYNNQDIGFQITLALFISMWCCDTFAYFFGKTFGQEKIMPNISPNKTCVGSISGLIGSLLVWFLLFYNNYFYDLFNFKQIIILSLIVGVIGQLGDFAESMIKRNANIKDASQILKGHGGVLDRFDSLAFASPVVYIYITYFILL